jgi:hypothetical protein
MEKQFVPYDLALKLKEKGFNEKCLGYYQNNELIITNITFYEIEKHNLGILAPLWQQVIDWLRIKYTIDLFVRQITKDGRAYFKITKIDTEDKIKGYSNFYDTVNIALNKAIERALTFI